MTCRLISRIALIAFFSYFSSSDMKSTPTDAQERLPADLAFAACDTDNTPAVSDRHLQPLSDRMIGDIEAKNMARESAILVRIFKEESELEVWKEDKAGRYALLWTYPMCRWSGELGPKIKQGDRQAPEGFYTITPNMMNPNPNYLAIDTGGPNAYDRANGRTGAFLMTHGDCSSGGCYANDLRADGTNLRAGPRIVLEWTKIIPDPGISVPYDPPEHGQASRLAAPNVLDNA
jgi:hypothetical protein